MQLYLHCDLLNSTKSITLNDPNDDLYTLVKDSISSECLFALPKLPDGTVLLHGENDKLVNGTDIYVEDYIFLDRDTFNSDYTYELAKNFNIFTVYNIIDSDSFSIDVDEILLSKLMHILRKYNIVDPYYECLIEHITDLMNFYVLRDYFICHVYYNICEYTSGLKINTCNLNLIPIFEVDWFYYYLDIYVKSGLPITIENNPRTPGKKKRTCVYSDPDNTCTDCFGACLQLKEKLRN